MEGLPGWGISSMPGPPPRPHKHERGYTPSTHLVIPTSRPWNDDYGGQMIFGDLYGPRVSWRLTDSTNMKDNTHQAHSVIPARRLWNDDYGGQMIFGDICGLKVSSHSSYRWGKTPKKPHPGTCPNGNRTRARCVTGTHATACSTAVDCVVL